MRPVALALSPHLDDAAFSCGGTLARLSGAGWRVVVATVFTASVPDPQGFALACQLDKGLGREVDYMALRRAEDAAAVAALGAEAQWLGLPEAPHRGYGSAAALFAAVRPGDDVGQEVSSVLANAMAAAEPDLVLAPQAIGGHVDHVHTVRALEALATDRPILWWRDVPYTAREPAPAAPFGATMGRLSELTVRLDPDAAARKRAACRAYASQLGFQFGGPEGLDAGLAAAERVERFRVTGRVPAEWREMAETAAVGLHGFRVLALRAPE